MWDVTDTEVKTLCTLTISTHTSRVGCDVISFPPGEATKEEAYAVINDFCEEYAVNQKDVRKNAIRINELYEECKYILKNDIKTEDDLLEKQNALLAKEKQLMNCRSSLRSVEDKEMLRQYRALKKRLSDTPDWDDRFEIYQEELNTFLKQMPEGMLKAEEERQQINAILQEIRHEERIVNRIVEEERSLNKEQKISKTERTEIRHRRRK